MTDYDREALVSELAALSEAEAKSVIDEARASDRRTRQKAAAQALSQYLGGTRTRS
jgi:hypothetical protein